MAASTVSRASEWIVYELRSAIWKTKSDGSGTPQQLTFPTGYLADSRPSVCSGGHRIVFERAGDIYKITQNGGTPVNLTPNTSSYDSDPDCGTDGETNCVVFQSDRLGGHAIYRMSLTNGNTTLLTDDGEQPAFCGTDRVAFMRVGGYDCGRQRLARARCGLLLPRPRKECLWRWRLRHRFPGERAGRQRLPLSVVLG